MPAKPKKKPDAGVFADLRCVIGHKFTLPLSAIVKDEYPKCPRCCNASLIERVVGELNLGLVLNRRPAKKKGKTP